jgi:hypothetical protein
VLPAASWAVSVTENEVPAVALAGATTTKRASAPEATVTAAGALVDVHIRQIAVTV